MTTFLNFSLIVAMLLNALIPLLPKLNQIALLSGNQETPQILQTPDTPQETPTPDPTFGSPVTPEPSVTPSPIQPTVEPSATPSSEPTSTPTAVIPVDGVQLSLSVTNSEYKPGSSAVVNWNIISSAQFSPESSWKIRFDLPAGFTPQDLSLGVYDSQANQFTVICSDIFGQLPLKTAPDTGDVVIHAVLLAGSTSLSEFSLPLQPKEFTLVGKNGGEVTGRSGKVKVKFPKDALSEDVEVTIQSPEVMPPLFEGSDGDVVELLAFSLGNGQPVHKFNRKVGIEISYDPNTTRIHPSKMTLFYYDEQLLDWVPLPGRANTETNTLQAETDHFSLFAVGSSQFDQYLMRPLDAAQVSDFTGSASYTYDIEVPTGPGGIKPSISLSYNSQSVEGAIAGQTQASNVGMGWSLSNGGNIARNRGANQDYDGDDTFSLNLGGMSYQLVAVSETPLGTTISETRTDSSGSRVYQISSFTDFQTTDASFLKIRRYNWKTSDNYWSNESWIVWDKTGGLYRFEERAYYYYACGVNGGCANKVWNWYLTSYQNVAGKALTYTYSKSERITQHGYLTLEITPVSIVYPDGKTRVEFISDSLRYDHQYQWHENYAPIPFESKRITSIRVVADNQIVREYQLNYVNNDASPFPLFPTSIFTPDEYGTNYGRVLVLSSLTQYGVGGIAGGNHMLPVLFSYDSARGYSMFLADIDNGQGGKVSFEYEAYDRLDVTKRPWSASNGGDSSQRVSLAITSDWVANSVNDRTALLGSLSTKRPGSTYKVTCPLKAGSNATARYYAVVGDPDIRVVSNDVQISGGGAYANYSEYITLPSTPSKFDLYLEYRSSVNPGEVIYFTACQVEPVLTHYRVTKKTITDSVTNATIWYSYDYTADNGQDSAAVNDTSHSTYASLAANLRSKATMPNAEFRGHGRVTVTDMNGLVTRTYYYQEDVTRGRSYKTQMMTNSGLMLSEKITTFVDPPVEFDNNPQPTYCAKDEASGSCFRDRRIFWFYPISEETHTYGSVGQSSTVFVGTKAEYAYDLAKQDNVQYGNLTQTVESYWTGAAWMKTRSTQVYYKTNATSREADRSSFVSANGSNGINNVKYLAGLAGVSNTYKCPNGTCDENIDNLIASSCNTYGAVTDTGYAICSIQSSGAVSMSVPTAGMLRAKRTLLRFGTGPIPNYSGPWYRDELYKYDTWGNQTEVNTYPAEGTDTQFASQINSANAVKVIRTFDPTFHSRLASEANALGHTAYYYYANLSNGYYLGLPTSEKNPNNAEAFAEYDAFGRISWVKLPDQTPGLNPDYKTYSVVYQNYTNSANPANIEVKRWFDVGTPPSFITSRSYFSGLGQKIQSVIRNVPVFTGWTNDWTNGGTPIIANKDIGTNIYYDDYGREKQTKGPFTNDLSQNMLTLTGVNPPIKTTTYDAWGRVSTVTDIDGAVTSYQYDVVSYHDLNDGQDKMVLRTETTRQIQVGNEAPAGWYTYLYTDAFGKTIRVTPPLNSHLTDNNSRLSMELRYTYDAAGNLLSVQKPKDGSTWLTTTMTYDLAGRKLDMNDPDMGHWYYGYDALGNLKSQVDAKSQWTCMYYDSLNRLTNVKLISEGSASCPESNTTGTDKVTLTYDQTTSEQTPVSGLSFSFTNSLGQLTKVKTAASTNYISYNIQGKVSKKTVILDPQLLLTGTDQVYSVENTYNHAGDLVSIKYPDNEDVTISYDSVERIKRTSGTGWTIGGEDTATVYDEFGRLRSNLVYNGSASLFRHNFQYYDLAAGVGKVGRLSGIAVGSLLTYTYTDYDVSGNLRTLQDAVDGGQTSQFTYDQFGRLLTASAAASTNQNLPGFSQSFTFDEQNGNLVSKTIDGVISSYTYDPDNQPHAVRAMGSDIFDYDANGNMRIRVEKGISYTQEWTSDNKLLRVSWSTGANDNHKVTFVYDGSGNRLLRIDQLTLPIVGGGARTQEITTVYIDGLFEKQIVTTAQNLTGVFASIQQ